MPFNDLREFIQALDDAQELLRVREEVDWRYEVGAWTRRSYDAEPWRPALLFERVKGYPQGYRIFTNGLATHGRVAKALGLPPETGVKELIQIYRERMEHLIPPELDDGGKVKENIRRGKEVNLLELPSPWWHPRDGGRYLGTWHINISKNAETGITNLGCYRLQVLDENHLAVGFLPSTHLGFHYRQRESQGLPLETAVALGVEESLVLAAYTRVPEQVDEYALAGGLRGAPVKVMKGETVDLCIPATAEMVLEGKILPHLRRPEGPFGEFTGYHGGGIRMRPVIEVTTMYYRNHPILRGMLHGKPVDELHVVASVTKSAAGLSAFAKWGPPGVKAIFCPPAVVPSLGAVIQMRPHYVGHSRDVGRFWLSAMGGGCKYVIIVDEDIDPFDLSQVWWAITTRTRASRDFEVLPFGRISRSDPSAGPQGEFTDYLIIDATKKLDYPYIKAYGGHWAPVCMPPKTLMDLVGLKWKKAVAREKVDQKELDRLQGEISQQEEHWQQWREENYSLSQQEQEAEAPRSYPFIAKASS